MTDTLSDFLLARIEEDQRAMMREWHAEECEHLPQLFGSEYTYSCNCAVPERMALECEAKRRIVAHCTDDLRRAADGYQMLPPVLEFLALPYANHPDYRAEWSPDA